MVIAANAQYMHMWMNPGRDLLPKQNIQSGCKMRKSLIVIIIYSCFYVAFYLCTSSLLLLILCTAKCCSQVLVVQLCKSSSMFEGERKQEQGKEGKLFTVCISCVAENEQTECSLHEVPATLHWLLYLCCFSLLFYLCFKF